MSNPHHSDQVAWHAAQSDRLARTIPVKEQPPGTMEIAPGLYQTRADQLSQRDIEEEFTNFLAEDSHEEQATLRQMRIDAEVSLIRIEAAVRALREMFLIA